MKKLGMVGGLGPESTVDYYQSIITKYQERIGSKEVLPELFINSINMYQVFQFIDQSDLDGLTDYLVEAVQKLEQVGSDFAIISANTPHIVFDQVQNRVQIPLYSIVEETYKKARELRLDKIGLIGTKFTMEHNFFKTPFTSNGIEIVVPTASEQQYIHKKIVEELENGIVNQTTKQKYLDIIKEMVQRDQIQGIILGCTELPMIIKKEDLSFPQLNTTEIHIDRIIDLMFT
ncbi:aspartate/glutamate racemase family protein [Lederbergia panacisoli]|uniref:aspartate/glutamate racemase family protein n=1 Tax=Lederbergia panacisoli TaxID=1255251 RepID=UPI00214C9EA1|nr:amino acid racemase [Lederbergia panacisoli]MCR2823885.1 amino acid racemase [Lederbergia panacisoli]